jgi:hypothetical protein
VLVESAPDGRRRRVLRPWGLPRSAPLAMARGSPGRWAAGNAAGLAAADTPTRAERWIVAALVLIVFGAVVVHDAPEVGNDSMESTSTRRSVSLAFLSKLAAPPILDAIVLEAPPLRESDSLQRGEPAVPRPDPNRIPRGARAASTATLDVLARNAAPAVGGQTTASRVPSLEDRGAATTLPAWRDGATVAAPGERWRSLDTALASCGEVGGAIPRAFCEQEARLLHCDGFWGMVADCPVTRSEYGQ